jgi:cystathionine beta-lyase
MVETSRETRLITPGPVHGNERRFVNPAIQRGSTVLFSTVAEVEDHQENAYDHFRYGRQGTPTHRAFEGAMCALEGGCRTFTTPSGLAAITAVLTAFSRTGCHILVPDNVYWPTRAYCSETLSRLGVGIEFYDPGISRDITNLFRPNTTLLYMESPGTATFEITDVPLLARLARQAGIVTAVDNTWATPLYFRPLEHGADISIHSATKYIMGHADGMMGCVTVNEQHEPALRKTIYVNGMVSAPEDAYLGLRGLRTLAARLRQHQETALTLAHWLAERPEVDHVRYPALPGAPGHELWKRDLTGASGLFSFVLKDLPKDRVVAMLESLKLFGMGYSWGGFESLALPDFGQHHGRTKMAWPGPGALVRVHAGLEAVGDLVADLQQGFEKLKG